MVRAMEPLILDIPVLIKAKTDANGRRLVEVESSNEAVDSEGDVILQSALLEAAPQFVKTGHLDIDHLSEIGDRYGIANPTSYIVGKPIEVKDIGGKRTSVVGQIMRASDGSFDPAKNKYDEFWQSLTSDPPVAWRASIYGFPTSDGLVDCEKARGENCYGAIRYLVKGISWRSLAFTRNPVNDAITGSARIITQKAFHEVMKSRIAKDYGGSGDMVPAGTASRRLLTPRNREELLGHWHGHMQKSACPCAGGENGNSIFTFRQHFEKCCGEPDFNADILALALMQLLKRERR